MNYKDTLIETLELECKELQNKISNQTQQNSNWVGKEYIVWYLNGGYFSRNTDNPKPKKVQGTLINVLRPFTGQIMIEEKDTKALYIVPFQSIVLMEEYICQE